MKDQPLRKDILAQLGRVLRSQVFRDSEMLRKFLSFTVNESLKEDGIALKQYSIAIHAFCRPPDFDATSDPIVRIQASRLRRNLEQYYRDEGKEDLVRIVLPKGTYVPEFSFTDEGIDSIISDEQAYELGETTYSIAVRPLKNLSPDKKMQHIVDGFSEELLMELSRYSHLQVIRTKEGESDIVNNSLSRFFLEGSMRFSESQVKISVGVRDNFNQQIIWTRQEKFDIDHCDLIQVQEDVATSVAQQTAGMTGIICEKLYQDSNWEETHSPKAYATYLHFYQYNKNPTEKNANELMAKVTELVENRPGFAPGWAVLANLCTDAYIFGLDPKNLELALSYGEKAVELQANNQMCQAYFGYALMVADRLEEAERHFEKTFSLNPNALYYTGAVGWAYCLLGKLEEGFKLVRHSMDIDFQYPRWFHMGPYLYYLNRKEYDKMLIEAMKFDRPELFWTPLLKLVAYHKLDQSRKTEEQLTSLMEIKPDFLLNSEAYVRCLVKSDALRKEILETFHAVRENANVSLSAK